MISEILYKVASLYTRQSPIRKGKKFIMDAIMNLPLANVRFQTKSKDGRIFEFDSSTKEGRLIFFFGESEPIETEIVRRIVEPNDVAIDVGANIGWYTTLLSRMVGTNGLVFAIEAVPHTFETLQRTARHNNCKHNTVLLNKICGDRDGVETIYEFPRLHPGLSSCRPIENEVAVAHRVKGIRVDKLVSEYNLEKIDFMKIDVEGGELGVLRGAIDSLQSGKIVSLLVEANDERSLAFGHNVLEWVYFVNSMNDYVTYKVECKSMRLREVKEYSDYSTGDNLLIMLRNSRKHQLMIKGCLN